MLVYPGLGDGQFGPATKGVQGSSWAPTRVGITVADLTGDGLPDLVVANKGSK